MLSKPLPLSQPTTRPDKRLVAESFSNAAATYDSVATLQRQVGEYLLKLLPNPLPTAHQITDLGCGTGYFTRLLQQQYQPQQLQAVDLAQGMLHFAKQQQSADFYIAGDAEQLPLANASQQLIFSSLALQWCDDFAQVLSEAKRVLQPGGLFAFSSLAEGTLHELKHSWRAVDDAVHVNNFRCFSQYQALCNHSGFKIQSLQCLPTVQYYGKLSELTHELKHLGANNLNAGRNNGLTGRKQLQTLIHAYDTFRQAQGLPATWQVVYGVLEKEG